MLLDDRSLPETQDPLDYPSKFPRTPIWAKKIQDWREKGFYETKDYTEFMSYSTCIIGEWAHFDITKALTFASTNRIDWQLQDYMVIAFRDNNVELAEDALMLVQFL